MSPSFLCGIFEELIVGGVVVDVAPLDVDDDGQAADEAGDAGRHPHEESPLTNLKTLHFWLEKGCWKRHSESSLFT